MFRNKERERRLQSEIDRQTAVISTLQDQIDRMADLLAESSGKFDALLESHSLLLAAHKDTLDALQVKENELKKLTEVPAASTFSQYPIHVPEWEENASYQLEQGLIDEDQYREILREAGLAPNIEVDVS